MEQAVFNFINGFALRYGWLDAFAIFLAKYLPYLLVACFFLFLLVNVKKYKKMAVETFFAIGLSYVIFGRILHLLIARMRPFFNNDVNTLLTHSFSRSFPSDHALFFFALSTIVFFYNKKAGILFFIASFLIGLARIFTGLHWPSDVVAGAVIGVISGIAVFYSAQIFFKEAKEN